MLWAVLVLAAVNLLRSYPVYFDLAMPATKDLVLSFQPMHAQLARQGWPPYRAIEPRGGFGFPQLAESQASQFYPLSFLARWLLDPDLGMFHLLYIHLFLTGVCMLWLCRELGLSTGAGLLASVSWSGCSSLVTALEAPSVLFQAALLPAITAGLASHARTARLTPLALSGLALGCQQLAGNFQVGFYSVLFLTAWSLFGSFGPGAGPGRRRAAVAWMFVLGIGAGLSWVQVRSTLGFLSHAMHMGLGESLWLSWPPYQALTLLQPFLFGVALPPFLGGPVPDRLATYWGPGVYWTNVCYVGVAPLVLAAGAWRCRRHPPVRFLGLALVAALAWAAGKHLPWNVWLFRLPLLDGFRFPVRVLVLVCFCLTLLAGFGLDALRAGGREALARWTRRLLLALAAMVVLLTAAWATVSVRPARSPASGPHDVAAGTARSQHRRACLDPLAPDNLTTAGLLLGTAAVLWFSRPKEGRLAALGPALVALTVLDLGHFLSRHQLWVPPEFYRSPPGDAADLERLIGDHRYFSVARFHSHPADRQLDLLPASLNLRTRLATADYRGSLFDVRFRRFFDTLMGGYVDAHGAIRPQPQHLGLHRLAGVGYLLRRQPAEGPGLEEVGGHAPRRIYRITGVLPRVRWVGRARWVDDAESSWRAINLPGFRAEDTVVLEGVPLAREGASCCAEVRAVESGPGWWRGQVEARSDGWLVVADTWLPGWTARVDDQPARIWRANYLFLAVAVPSGLHQVVLEYSEPGLREGAVTAALALLAFLGCVGLDLVRPGRGFTRPEQGAICAGGSRPG